MVVAEEVVHRERKKIIEHLRRLGAMEDERKIVGGLEELAVDLRTRREIARLVEEGKFQTFPERLEMLLDAAVRNGIISRSKVLAKKVVYNAFRKSGLVPKDIWDLYTKFLQKRKDEAKWCGVVYGYTLNELERELIRIKEKHTSPKDALRRIIEALEKMEDPWRMEGKSLAKDLRDMYILRAGVLLGSKEKAVKGRAEIEALKALADSIIYGGGLSLPSKIEKEEEKKRRTAESLSRTINKLLSDEFLKEYAKRVARAMNVREEEVADAVRRAVGLAMYMTRNKDPRALEAWAEEIIKSYPRLAAVLDLAIAAERIGIKRRALMKIFRNAVHGVE